MKKTIFTLAVFSLMYNLSSAQLDVQREDTNQEFLPNQNVQLNQISADRLDVFSFFPNPVQNQFTLVDADKVIMVQVLDFSGNLIKEIPNGMSPLDISDLRAGSYILLIHKNDRVIRERLEKK